MHRKSHLLQHHGSIRGWNRAPSEEVVGEELNALLRRREPVGIHLIVHLLDDSRDQLLLDCFFVGKVVEQMADGHACGLG